MLSIELVHCVEPGAAAVLTHSVHRVPPGTTIRTLLAAAIGPAVVADIEATALGLARHGRRAWLDDLLVDGDRVEVVRPLTADARARRFERVAATRRR